MLLRSFLDFAVPLLWLATLLVFGWYLWRVGRRHGLFTALRRLLSKRVLAPLAALLLITYTSMGLAFIDPREVGVVVSLLHPDGVRERPIKPGLRWIWPLLEYVERYPTIKQTYTMSGRTYEGQELGDDAIRARTADGQLVIIDVSAVFRIDAELAVELHREWQHRYIEEFIRPGLRAFVRSQASRFSVDDINSHKRKAFETALNELTREHCRDSGIKPDVILVRNITFSPEYALSVEEKMTAKQRIVEAKHKADQVVNLAQGEADKIRIRASADADAIREIASAEARAHVVKAEAEAEALNLIAAALEERDNLLTYRYIDKLSPNISAMLLPNNAPLILPMPELGEPGEPPAALPAVQRPQLPPAAEPAPNQFAAHQQAVHEAALKTGSQKAE